MIIKFIKNDSFDLMPSNFKDPYISFIINKEDFERIKNMKTTWFEANGQHLFKVKDKDGKETGETMAFLLFVE
jgi:hypothetical protein